MTDQISYLSEFLSNLIIYNPKLFDEMTSDIGQRVNFDVSFDKTFDSDFPAQFYVDSCTVTDVSTGKV